MNDTIDSAELFPVVAPEDLLDLKFGFRLTRQQLQSAILPGALVRGMLDNLRNAASIVVITAINERGWELLDYAEAEATK